MGGADDKEEDWDNASSFEDPFDTQGNDQGNGSSSSGGSTDWAGGWNQSEGRDQYDGRGDNEYGDGRPAPQPPQQQPQQPSSRQQQQPMNEAEIREKLGYGLCVAEFLINGLQGAVLGSVVGAFGGAGEAYKVGARGKPLVEHTLLRARGSAASFGVWIGTYRGAKCSLIQMRGGKKDLMNAFVAGSLAGGLPALPTRQPRVILFSALGSGALVAAIEGLESMWH